MPIDAPMRAAPVRIRWRKRRFRWVDDACEIKSFAEQDTTVAAPGSLRTTRALSWAVAQMPRASASVQSIASQLEVSWKTVWWHVEPVLE